ncbi:MAG: hypothetical protein ACRD3T_19915, partial [Terriglobia bacterium]
VNCGQSWTKVSGPSAAWVSNLQNFYLDLYNAGIYNIAPTMSHGDLTGVSSQPGSSSAQYLPAAPNPKGKVCMESQPILQYTPGEPFGNLPCTSARNFAHQVRRTVRQREMMEESRREADQDIRGRDSRHKMRSKSGGGQ